MNDQRPMLGDEDTCPICLMPVYQGSCLRHDTAEMIAWGNVFRRERDEARAEVARLNAMNCEDL